MIGRAETERAEVSGFPKPLLGFAKSAVLVTIGVVPATRSCGIS
ncbi:hypothetical protein [Lentzea albidocapillata]|nr:hypothetical protein [Lentzea albidocapillata]